MNMTMHHSVFGTYLLLLECGQAKELSIGRLGQMKTGPGYYLYVGSAYGPGGVPARIKHHMQPVRRPHWHLDYLRTAAHLVDAWCVYDVRHEHEWANKLMQSGELQVPLKGFGSSDCKCLTHLFYSERKPVNTVLEDMLNSKLSSVDITSRY